MVYLIVLVAAVILIGLVVALWRIWDEYAQISPEDEEFERSIADLNDQQANRQSDRQLRRVIDTDTGWQIMVRRGASERQPRRRRPPRR